MPIHTWLNSLRSRRGMQLAVVNLRIAIGFAFLPAGLKKLLGQPFTDPDKTGVFHEFLHAFHAASPLYHLVGATQLIAASMLLTQRFAPLGAMILLPVLIAINALCWSSSGIPTIVVVNLMTMGTIALLLWDFERLRPLLAPLGAQLPSPLRMHELQINEALWSRCGLAILVVYLFSCALQGGVYRPRGFEPSNPAFYLLPLLLLFPVVTWRLDRPKTPQ